MGLSEGLPHEQYLLSQDRIILKMFQLLIFGTEFKFDDYDPQMQPEGHDIQRQWIRAYTAKGNFNISVLHQNNKCVKLEVSVWWALLMFYMLLNIISFIKTMMRRGIRQLFSDCFGQDLLINFFLIQSLLHKLWILKRMSILQWFFWYLPECILTA